MMFVTMVIVIPTQLYKDSKRKYQLNLQWTNVVRLSCKLFCYVHSCPCSVFFPFLYFLFINILFQLWACKKYLTRIESDVKSRKRKFNVRCALYNPSFVSSTFTCPQRVCSTTAPYLSCENLRTFSLQHIDPTVLSECKLRNFYYIYFETFSLNQFSL